MTKSMFNLKIVSLLCDWFFYAGADLISVSRIQYPSTLRIMRMMCSGRVNTVFILDASRSETDGALFAITNLKGEFSC